MIPPTGRLTGARIPIVLCLVSALACGGDRGNASASGDSAAMAARADEGSLPDRMAVTRISAANAAEIEVATLAAGRATSDGVKGFAQRMVEEHSRFQMEIDSLVTRLDIPARPVEEDSLQQALDLRRDSLRVMAAGAAWDLAYMSLQVRVHEASLELLGGLVDTVRNAELRDAIQQEVPVVQGHLDHARQVFAALDAAPSAP